MILKLLPVALFLAAPLAAPPAQAQAPAAAVAVGMPVVDAKGGAVGIISSRNGTNVTLKTDRHDIPLPASSFTVDQGKAYFGMTRAQINAEYERLTAAAAAALVAGAEVRGLNGQRIGTIAAIDDKLVTLKLDSGEKVELPRSGIAGTPDGAVIGITAEDLQKKLAGS